jgi:Sugar (and other) transporter
MWLPVVSLVGFVTVYCMGFGSLPWIVLSEIFPNNVKSIASAIVSSVNCLLAFVITRWFDSVDKALGTHWIFWIFSIFCAAAYLFTYTMLFETKGLSFLEIQNKLNGRSTEETD